MNGSNMFDQSSPLLPSIPFRLVAAHKSDHLSRQFVQRCVFPSPTTASCISKRHSQNRRGCCFRLPLLPVFDWERPYHEKYPEDTPLSYRQAFASVIKNPEYAVLVALDKYESDEATKSKAIIPPNNGAEIPAEGDEVLLERLVGSWRRGRGGLGNSKMTDFTNCAQMEGRASNFCIQVHTQSCHRISIATRTQVTATFLPKVLKPLKRSSFTTPGDRCFSC